MSKDVFRSTDPALRAAHRRAGAKMGFLIHLAVFVVVNTGLVLLDFLALRWHGFSIWPLAGWGLGLAVHGLAVSFMGTGAGIRRWLLERELARLGR